MPSSRRTTTLALLAATAATAGLATAASSTTAAGGLSIAPAILEHPAILGSIGQLRVANGSNRTISIRVHTRPWTQSRTGAVDAIPRKTLKHLRLGATTFTLAPGTSRTITATLRSRPSGGSLYGAIEVIGTPQGGTTNGVRAKYRLLGSLRLNPSSSARRLRLRIGTTTPTTTGATVAVRNLGNTVEPITGSVRIASAAGTLRSSIAAQRILPGAVVNLPIQRSRLRSGTYKATITLRQAGRQVATATRTFRVR